MVVGMTVIVVVRVPVIMFVIMIVDRQGDVSVGVPDLDRKSVV